MKIDSRDGNDLKHLDKLIDIEQDEDSERKDLILLERDYIFVQNHSPNDAVSILIRKIYNYMSQGKELAVDLKTEYTYWMVV